MKLYELAYLLPPQLTEEERRATKEKLRGSIEAMEGIFESDSPLAQKRLAYPIKKTDMAYFGALSFHLDPPKLPSLQEQLRQEAALLRFLLVTKYIPSAKKERRPARKRIPPLPRAPAFIKPKVKMEKIDEKLEELLKE